MPSAMVGADAVADQETRATRRGGLCPSRLPTLPESRPEVINARRSRADFRALCGDLAELGDDVVPVRLERLLLPVSHQVDVELVHADRLELLELLRRVRDSAEHAEAVDDLVRDELAVRSPDARVILVVVELPRLDEVGEVLRDLRVLAVTFDQIHDVVRHHCREPTRLFARICEVIRDMTRRTDDALELARVPICLLGGAP